MQYESMSSSHSHPSPLGDRTWSHSIEAPVADNQKKEIGEEAVWQLSSAKSGNGVEQLRDDNKASFW